MCSCDEGKIRRQTYLTKSRAWFSIQFLNSKAHTVILLPELTGVSVYIPYYTLLRTCPQVTQRLPTLLSSPRVQCPSQCHHLSDQVPNTRTLNPQQWWMLFLPMSVRLFPRNTGRQSEGSVKKIHCHRCEWVRSQPLKVWVKQKYREGQTGPLFELEHPSVLPLASWFSIFELRSRLTPLLLRSQAIRLPLNDISGSPGSSSADGVYIARVWSAFLEKEWCCQLATSALGMGEVSWRLIFQNK